MDAYIDGLVAIAERCEVGECFHLDTPVVQRVLGIAEADLLDFVRAFEKRANRDLGQFIRANRANIQV